MPATLTFVDKSWTVIFLGESLRPNDGWKVNFSQSGGGRAAGRL